MCNKQSRPCILLRFVNKEGIIPFELAEDHIIDQEEGLTRLLSLLLIIAMQSEAVQKSGSELYQ